MRSHLRLLALCLFMAGCGAVQPELGTWERTTFWEPFQFNESMEEVTGTATIRELADASDSIVRARVTGVRNSRIIQGESAEDQVAMVCVDLQIEAVIAGTVPDAVCLEFIGGSPAGADAVVQRSVAMGLPRQSVVVFLHEKRGRDEAGLYRVTNSTGLWAATSREALDSPLRPEPPGASGLYAGELEGIGTVPDLARRLAQIGSGGT